MKKLFAAFAVILSVFVFVPSIASAGLVSPNCDSISVPNLDEASLIKLKQACIDTTNKTGITNISTSDVSEYAELGKKYGIALSEVAKSIGTTVNELATTPVGKFMLVIVAYKVLGSDLLGFIAGALWFITMLPLWLYMVKRTVFDARPYSETIDDKGRKTRAYGTNMLTDKQGDVSASFGMLILWIIVLALIAISGFVMIF